MPPFGSPPAGLPAAPPAPAAGPSPAGRPASVSNVRPSWRAPLPSSSPSSTSVLHPLSFSLPVPHPTPTVPPRPPQCAAFPLQATIPAPAPSPNHPPRLPSPPRTLVDASSLRPSLLYIRPRCFALLIPHSFLSLYFYCCPPRPLGYHDLSLPRPHPLCRCRCSQRSRRRRRPMQSLGPSVPLFSSAYISLTVPRFSLSSSVYKVQGVTQGRPSSRKYLLAPLVSRNGLRTVHPFLFPRHPLPILLREEESVAYHSRVGGRARGTTGCASIPLPTKVAVCIANSTSDLQPSCLPSRRRPIFPPRTPGTLSIPPTP